MIGKVLFRRGAHTSTKILDPGEPGWAEDTNELKVGDGATPFVDLPAIGADDSGVTQEYVDGKATPPPVSLTGTGTTPTFADATLIGFLHVLDTFDPGSTFEISGPGTSLLQKGSPTGAARVGYPVPATPDGQLIDGFWVTFDWGPVSSGVAGVGLVDSGGVPVAGASIPRMPVGGFAAGRLLFGTGDPWTVDERGSHRAYWKLATPTAFAGGDAQFVVFGIHVEEIQVTCWAQPFIAGAPLVPDLIDLSSRMGAGEVSLVIFGDLTDATAIAYKRNDDAAATIDTTALPAGIDLYDQDHEVVYKTTGSGIDGARLADNGVYISTGAGLSGDPGQFGVGILRVTEGQTGVGYVLETRTVAGHPLDGPVTLTPEDVGIPDPTGQPDGTTLQIIGGVYTLVTP